MENLTFICETTETGQNCSYDNNIPMINGMFSSGEMIISLFLFILIIFEIIKFIIKGVGSVSVVREYTGNNSPDGKEQYKI